MIAYQMKMSPQSVKTLVNYSVVLRNKGQEDVSLKYLGKAFEMYPDYPEISLGMGAVWISKGNLPQAEFWLKRCLDLNPSHIEAMNLLGRVLLNQSRNEEAKTLLTFARELEPQHVKSSVALLAACLNLKDISCAGKLRTEIADVAANDPEYQKLVELMEGKG